MEHEPHLELVEDPRAQLGGICGVTKIGATGIEWICIKKVHGKVYQRRRGRSGLIFSNNPSVDAHLFVRRWKALDDPDAQQR